MAALDAALLTKPALDAALAATAAKGSLGIYNNKSGIKTLGDPLQDWGDAGGKTKKKKYSQDELDDAMIEMVSRGLNGKEALRVVNYVKEHNMDLDKAVNMAIMNRVQGKPILSFPESKKPEGTPPVTGTKVKKETTTTTPDGSIKKETTTTFDSTAGGKKSTRTEIPEDDLAELFSKVDFAKLDNLENDPVVKKFAEARGYDIDKVVRDLINYRKNFTKSFRDSEMAGRMRSDKITKANSGTHGRAVNVDTKEIVGAYDTQAEQNMKRHEVQKQRVENEERIRQQMKKEEWERYLSEKNAPKFED